MSIQADQTSGAVWVLSDKHAWMTSSNGDVWTKTTLVPSGAMQGLAFADSITGWAVTRNGIVQQLLSNPFVVSASAHSPEYGFQLGAPHPNPLSTLADAVLIPFTLSEAAPVRLSVYNTSGKEVSRIFDQRMPPGEHTTFWDPVLYCNGVYFIVMQSEGRSIAKRIVLAR